MTFPEIHRNSKTWKTDSAIHMCVYIYIYYITCSHSILSFPFRPRFKRVRRCWGICRPWRSRIPRAKRRCRWSGASWGLIMVFQCISWGFVGFVSWDFFVGFSQDFHENLLEYYWDFIWIGPRIGWFFGLYGIFMEISWSTNWPDGILIQYWFIQINTC